MIQGTIRLGSFPNYKPGVIFYDCHEATEGSCGILVFSFGPQAQIRRQCEEEIGRVLEEKVRVGPFCFVVHFFC